MRKILLLLILASTILSCTKHKDQEKSEVKPSFTLTQKMASEIKWERPKLLPVSADFRLYGKVVTDNNKLIEVFPFVSGNVLAVKVELGDYVKKGQLMAVVQSVEAADFEKQMQDAENDVLVAKRNHRTSQELFEGKLNSERDVLIAKNELEKAQSQLKRVKDIYTIYNLKPGSIYEIRAPISGFVIQKNINQDMHLRSDHSNNVFDIAQLDAVWVMANVNESDIGKIKVGMSAQITTISYPDEILEGQVDKIFNVVDVESKAMKARIKLKNKDYLLKPEMFATVNLRSVTEKKLLAIPSSSIIFDKNKYFVMLFKSDKDIETRQIVIHRQSGDITFISAGLTEQDKIITVNQLLIYDALND